MRHQRQWNDGPTAPDFLTDFAAPAIARRHICSGGGGGPLSVLQPVIDVGSVLAAPFTGGASLALPFAFTGAEDIASGNFNNLPLQLAGDTLAAFTGGAGDLLSGAATGALDATGAVAGAGLGDTLGALGTTAVEAGGGLGAAEAGLGGAAAAGLAGAAGDGGFGFGDLSGAFGGLGGEPAPTGADFGGAAGVPAASPLPTSSFGGITPDVGPVGGGGTSVASGLDPFGVGGPGGVATGGATAQNVTFGDPTGVTSSVPSTPALDPNAATAGANPADYQAIFGNTGVGPTGTATGPLAGTSIASGGNMGGGGGGFFGGIKDFLKNNKDLITLGTGALGVGKAIYSNAQMQGGIDALMAQAQQARLNAGEFQNGYNSLLQQALPLIQQGASGNINPQQAANLLTTANRMKTQIQARYASMGGGGNSTAMQQDLNNVDAVIAGLQGTLATAQISAGAQVANAATGQGGLNAQNANSIAQFARLSAASDAELNDALYQFASAAAGGPGQSR